MTYRYIQLEFVEEEVVKAQEILNPNAFVEYLRPDINAAVRKLALIEYSISFLDDGIIRDSQWFIEQLHTNQSLEGFIPNPRKPLLAVCSRTSFQVALQSLFISAKSFLDIYARIIARSLQENSQLFGFNKANFRGNRIVGGSLLNWIERSCPKSYANKDKLIEIILNHIKVWITDVVVVYRDDIIHKGKLNWLVPMCVPLVKDPQKIDLKELVLPQIKGKGYCLDYCRFVNKHAYDFLRETLILLPNVDRKLIKL